MNNARKRPTQLDQVIIGATPGDAITDEAFLIQRWLRELGFSSEIFAQFIDPALTNQIRPMSAWHPQANAEWVAYHHSIGSAAAERLMATARKLILIYHNVTPPEFFAATNPALHQEMLQGRAQLVALRAHTPLALADSFFNERDLIATGFARTGVLPIALDEARLNLPLNRNLLAHFGEGIPTLLFVGRQVPNKRQEDLLKLLYYYRRIEPGARLFLVGDEWTPAYSRWLRDVAADLGLDDAVIFAGKSSQQDLVTIYQLASVYVSMSEHEGFGKPLIESMYLGVPVFAFAAAAVPGTLGEAGVQFHAKDYEALAEAIDLLARDEKLRARLIARQRARAQEFLAPRVFAQWQIYLGELFDFPDRSGF